MRLQIDGIHEPIIPKRKRKSQYRRVGIRKRKIVPESLARFQNQLATHAMQLRRSNVMPAKAGIHALRNKRAAARQDVLF
jgi:hypothetical protein